MEDTNTVQRNTERTVEPMAPEVHAAHTPSRGAIWLLVIVCIVIALLVLTSKKPLNDDAAVGTTPATLSQDICYYASTPTASGLTDTAALKLTVTSDNAATGELSTVPAEKDAMRGTLSGTVAENGEELVFDGWYANAAEGMNNTDQRLIKLTETEARVGYGEMAQNVDGTYSYKNVAEVNYSLAIPRVDCAVYEQAVSIRP